MFTETNMKRLQEQELGNKGNYLCINAGCIDFVLKPLYFWPVNRFIFYRWLNVIY